MYYINGLYEFFDQLSRNNNREWFAANKSRYERLRELWLADVDKMIAHMSVWCPELSGQTGKSCAYRIYRDTRFSNDKTPYKLHFGASISPWGRKSDRAGYYLHLGHNDMTDSGLYGGVYCPDSAMLKKIRRAIVDNIEEFTDIISAPTISKYFPGWVGDMLKTVPKGWDRNHPNAELLRLKEYGKYHSCDKKFFCDPEWPERSAEIFSYLNPLINFLNYSIDE